jgi:hypothetical protein
LLAKAALGVLVAVGNRSGGASTGSVPKLLAVLSAIGTLSADAAVGAYAGAREAHRLREGVEPEREDREQNGLLRLVFTEITLHRALV